MKYPNLIATSQFLAALKGKLLFKISVFLLLLTFSAKVAAQDVIYLNEPLKVRVTRNLNIYISKGQEFFLTEIHGVNYESNWPIHLRGVDSTGKGYFLQYSRLHRLEFLDIDNSEKVWSAELIKNDSYLELLKSGQQYFVRGILFEESNEYIKSLESANRFFEDAYFEDYLYSLMNKIYPTNLLARRPGNLFIKIVKDPKPSALSLPNGAIILSTGLFSLLESEDELVAILSQQMAHFILDHHVRSYNKQRRQQRQAAFWSSFATHVAFGAEVNRARNDPYYLPGDLTRSTAFLASVVSDEVLTRLGMVYKYELEKEADQVTKAVLKTLNYSDSSMAVVLQRINNYYTTNRIEKELSPEGLFPFLFGRIRNLGYVNDIQSIKDPAFKIKTSTFHSYNAWVELWQQANPAMAAQLAKINIDNEVATEIDYLTLAISIRRQSNQPNKIQEAISLLHLAKNLGITPFLIVHKEEALCYFRIGQHQEAKFALEIYLNKLIELRALSQSSEEIENEITWSRQMLLKWNKL